MLSLNPYGKNSNRGEEKSKRKQRERIASFFSSHSRILYNPKSKKQPLQRTQRIKTKSKEKYSQETSEKKSYRKATKARQDKIDG